LHLDTHLELLIQDYGIWIYLVLFLVIFVETGLVIMPFLPGDSLLFVCGALAAVGGLDVTWLTALLTVAAISGDALNYAIGRRVGARVWRWEQSRWFNRAAFERTHAFYEQHGPMTIVVARFLPFVRTFAPFVAGVALMHYPRFALYNVLGAVLWVFGLILLGFYVGNLPWVKAHFSWVALALIVVPALPACVQFLRYGRTRNAAPTA